MLVKNLTPFFHGTKLTSRHPPAPEMMLVVRGTFRLVPDGVVTAIEGLDQGFLSGDVYSDGDSERTGELLHASDFADFKLNAEVLLQGSCRPPRGQAVTQCPIRFQVGEWKKDLVVFGDRTWEAGLLGDKPSAPAPFAAMPLGWTRAFGGPGLAANPVGRGMRQELLPNVEDPEHLLGSRGDRPAPAGFGPINPLWPPRAGKVGTNYGRSYLATRSPYYADDFDWTHFHAALPDQQLPGYLRGDEQVVLLNLVEGHGVLSTRLPSLRVRAFLKDDRGSFRELTMALDTLGVDTDAQTLSLSWRGVTPVREDDFADVRTMLIASEPLGEKRRPTEEYQTALEAFEKDPTGVLASLPAGMLEAWERFQADKRGEPMPAEPAPAGVDPVTGLVTERMGKLASAPMLAAVGAGMSSLPQEGSGLEKVDFPSAVEQARAQGNNDPPPVRGLKPGRLPDAGLRRRMRLVQNEVDKLRKLEAETGQKLTGLEQLAAVPHDPSWQKLEPDYQPPGPLSTDTPGPGADLREHDFTEQDLHGMDLSGANLERAILTRANLRGAKLRGAKLGRALLYLAELADADLTGADLTLANAAYVHAEGADFTRATLDEAFFEGARLARAKLDEAAVEYVVLEQADLTNASAIGARFDHSDFSKAKLGGVRFRGCSAVLCLFGECTAEKADFSGAQLRQASFIEADLRGARFVEARAVKGFFMKAKLDGADFGLAVLVDAHLTEASAIAARFYGANLLRARLYRTNLTRAELVRANLMSADLRKSNLTDARLMKSNLYDAKLIAVRGTGYDLTGANLKRALLEEA